jgi:hypothetical protein
VREYGRVHSAFWSSADVEGLSDDGKLVALYLLSCSHGTIAGVCRLPDGYVSEDLKWSSARVAKGFEELFAKGFSDRCETTKWVWIRKFLQWNAPENPNQWKAVWKVVSQIPALCGWRSDFLTLLSKLTGKEPPPDANPSETVSEPFRNLNSNSNSNRSSTEEVDRSARPSRSPTASRLPADFALTAQRRAIAEAEKADAEREFANFTDHWRSASGAKARKHDWDATWRIWCRRAADFKPRINGSAASEPQLTWRPPPDEEDRDVPN